MSLNSNDLPAGGGTEFEPMEPGTYPARTVCMIDLGLQDGGSWQDKKKPPVNKIALTYEFVDEWLKDEDGNDMKDKPKWLTEMMPFYSLGADKAKSTKRYLALDPKNVHEGDFSMILDVPCMVTVVHNPNKKKPGQVWENIAGVTAMREKDAAKCDPLVNDTLIFDLDDPDVEVFTKLPKFIQAEIKKGLEYEGSKLYGLLGDESAPEAEGDVSEDTGEDTPY